MSIIPQPNFNFVIKKNEIAFHEGQDVNSINILLKGKFDIYISPCNNNNLVIEEDIIRKSFRIFSINQNLFLSTNDLYQSKKHSFSFRAAEDSNLCTLIANNTDEVKAVISSQKDYAARIITSISALIEQSYSALIKLERLIKYLTVLTDNLTMYYSVLKEEYGYSSTPSANYFREGLENSRKVKDVNFLSLYKFDSSLFEKDNLGSCKPGISPLSKLDTSKIEYYKHLSELPLEMSRSFFAGDYYIPDYHYKDSSECLNDIQSALKNAFNNADELFKRLYSEDKGCIFNEYIKAVNEMRENNQDTTTVLQVVDYIVNKIKTISSIYEVEYLHTCDIDINYLTHAHSQAKMAADSSIEVTGGDVIIPDELKDSARKILEYSGIPKNRADLFRSNLEAFKRLKDKLSTETEAQNIRNSISSVFFEIYDAVYKKVVTENNDTRIFHMFLNYAYMDERLLSTENTLLLYKLSGKNNINSQFPVYNIKEWLDKIYDKEREPSINEFGQDYSDILRESKRRGNVTDKASQESDNDISKKIKFEIDNMFRINQRVCHGQISVYFPILHNEMFSKNLVKAIITPQMIEDSIKKILEIDFSAFHRQVSYRNAEKGLEKEFIMKSVIPDIILMPTFGSRASMWQEISVRNRSNPGRFIFPAFTGEKLDEMMLKLIGNFRWELCRTMMGTSWNDPTEKSLTSEYSDYIQFYKKNKDLTLDAKEKIRAQTVKYHNMAREIFTSDYETWINYESKGNVRLNKIVRAILYQYCPFSRPIREYLENQPMYSEMALQFRNSREKEASKFEIHYNKIIKSGIDLDEECIENLKFYKEL